jgi:hypothetical protein
MGTRDFSLWPKGPERGADHSTSSGAEVKNAGATIPHPNICPSHSAQLIKHKEKFAFKFRSGRDYPLA